MPKTFAELVFDPTIEHLQEIQRGHKVTVLTGSNNSGKSAYLKKFSENDQVLYIGPSRFYSFHYMGLHHIDPNELTNFRNNMRNQRTSQFSNFEGTFYDTNRALSRLANDRRNALFGVFTDLFGLPISVKQETPNNDFSQKYIDVDGDSLSVTSSGTRLFLGLLAALMDERFNIVAFDEPELGLSPTLQAKLAPIVVGRQRDAELFPHNPHFFISTHAHMFLDKDSPTNNFVVRREGNLIRADRCKDRQELMDIQFRMLGNDLSSLFLPDAILFVEGETDQLFLNRVLQFAFPDKKIVVEKCSGNLAGRLHSWSNTLGDLQTGPYRARTFVVADSEVQSGLERVIERLGIPPTSVVRWDNNGIEYVYPLSSLSRIFAGQISSHDQLQLTGDHVSAFGITKTKMNLATVITAGLTPEVALPEELMEKLIVPIRNAIASFD